MSAKALGLRHGDSRSLVVRHPIEARVPFKLLSLPKSSTLGDRDLTRTRWSPNARVQHHLSIPPLATTL